LAANRTERVLSPPRRILLVLQSTAVGGMEAHCRDLAREFTSRGIAVQAVLPPPTEFDQLASDFESSGVTVSRFHTDSRSGRILQAPDWLRFVFLLRRFQPDVVHLHTGGSTGGLAVASATRLLSSATMVVTEHDVPLPHRTGFIDRLAKNLMDFLCHAVVSVSRRQATIRHEKIGGTTSKLVTVLNGVPVKPIDASEVMRNRDSVRSDLGLAKDARVLGSVVRLDEGKGLDTLIASFAQVRQSLDCELLLVGDGPLRGVLEAQARDLGVDGYVHFAGFQ
jgi:glycosyltransferase involved in cell wall biosynthesis